MILLQKLDLLLRGKSHYHKLMESQDEKNPKCSSSNIIPIENESQMPSQTNEATYEVIEIEQRRFTSKAWQHFKPVKADDVRFSVCRCTKKPTNLITEGGSEVNDGSQQQYFDQDVSRRELAHAIILHEYPLSIVDHVGFRKFVASLQRLFKMVPRTTFKNDILKFFDNLKSKTSKLLETLTCRTAITTDMWTLDNNKKGFMAITTHFIDDSWRLQSYILRFVYVPAPHDKDTLCGALLNCLLEWNLERRISTIIVDNCSTNNAMMKTLLNDKLCKEDLLLMCEFFMCVVLHIS
ncbi:hypothetical protein KY289_026570 [Solanum tuberosum]|nr:hypothetical protein KY289_026570 [Solanum tuberosum]